MIGPSLRRARGAPLSRVLGAWALLAFAPASLAAQQGNALLGRWRVTVGRTAPWVPATARPDTTAWLGAEVRVEATQVSGPDPLRCERATFTPTRLAPPGLFQGMLPDAAASARTLGFGAGAVRGVRLDCTSGSFEFHQPDDASMLVAVDNVIWTLDRAPGARAAATAPEGVVQRFLERHFAGMMSFDSAAMTRVRPFLSDGLAERIARYLARPRPDDEPPPIEGDPFTDTQEYPTRFAVQAAVRREATALVPVRFRDGYRSRRVTYVLRRQGRGWVIDDLRFERGPSFRAVLAE